MFNKKIKKTIFLVNVDNYAPEITRLTYPLIELYARKIGASIHVISTRKFPGYPPVYEKLQIYELAQELENDWNIYIDSDALIHPDTPDITVHLPKDTVLHHGADLASNRWKYDRYFMRDGRNIGSCNWLAVASDWCIELWKPLDDLTREEAIKNIVPIQAELNTIITPDHLIDDYTLSRNIAKYGLKFKQFREIIAELGQTDSNYFWHIYTETKDEKVKQMAEIILTWGAEGYYAKGIQQEIKRLAKIAAKEKEQIAQNGTK